VSRFRRISLVILRKTSWDHHSFPSVFFYYLSTSITVVSQCRHSESNTEPTSPVLITGARRRAWSGAMRRLTRRTLPPPP
jgi:hypothetical protein